MYKLLDSGFFIPYDEPDRSFHHIMEKIKNVRLIVIIAIILASGYFFWNYINKYLTRSRAGGIAADIRLSETTGTFPLSGIQKDIVVTIQPRDVNDTIVAVDITLQATGVIQFTPSSDISGTQVSTGTRSDFVKLINSVSTNTVRLSYVIIDGVVPNNATFTLHLNPTGEGQGTVRVTQAQVVDQNAVEYSLGTVDEGNYSFEIGGNVSPTPSVVPSGGVTPSITPGATITVVPTGGPTGVPTPTPCPTQGDMDCDGQVEQSDLDDWINAFRGNPTSASADFDNNGTVDLWDFEIWRSQFFANMNLTPSP